MKQNIYLLKPSVKIWLIVLLIAGGWVSGQIYIQKGASVSLKGNALIAVTDTVKNPVGTPAHVKTIITGDTETNNLKYVSNTEIDYYPEKSPSSTTKVQKKYDPKISLEPEKSLKKTAPPAQKKEPAPTYSQNHDNQQSMAAGSTNRFAMGVQDYHQKILAETTEFLQKTFLILPDISSFAYRILPAQYVSGNSLFIRPPPAVFDIRLI